MKKYLIAALLAGFIVGPRPAYATMTFVERIQNLVGSFKGAPELVVGESAVPIVFFQRKTSTAPALKRIGTVVPFLNWGVISLDGGFLTGDLDYVGSERGAGFGGGSVHLDRVLVLLFPELKSIVAGYVPGSAERLVYRIQGGFGIGYDSTLESTIDGFFVGPEFKF